MPDNPPQGPILDYAGPHPASGVQSENPLWLLPAVLVMVASGIGAVVLGAVGGSVVSALWGVSALTAEFCTITIGGAAYVWGFSVLTAEYHILWHRSYVAGWAASALAGLMVLMCLYGVYTADGDFPARDAVVGLFSMCFTAVSIAHACWSYPRTPRLRKRRYRT